MWPAEAMQMLSGDVPAFACNFQSTTLTTLGGLAIPKELGSETASLEISPQRAAIMRVRDELPQQGVWIEQKRWINAAFRARGAVLPVSCVDALNQKPLELRAIDRIINSIGSNPERVFGVDSLSVLVGEDFDRAWEPGACGDELYGGMAGIIDVLLLHETPQSKALLQRCRESGLKWVRDTWKVDSLSRLGVWDGAGGVLLTLIRLHRGHRIPEELISAVERYSRAVLSLLERNKTKRNAQNDDHLTLNDAIQEAEIIGGAAGRIRFWVELTDHADPRLAAIASTTVERELLVLKEVLHHVSDLDEIEQDNRGYAHGVAGIVDTYLGASRMLGRDLDEDSAVIRRHIKAMGEWLQVPSEVPRGWCHGLAGYALTLWECAQDRNHRDEALGVLSLVVENLTHVDEGIGPSSCHGSAGIVETLDTVSVYYQVSEAREQYCKRILRPALSEKSSIKESGAAALMCGLAGVLVTVLSPQKPCGVVSAPWHHRPSRYFSELAAR
ncbi:hypothetical protein CPHO_01455 [Corynebacterium phocae]|uniref:Lantibiotic biosynthesis protein dehydration domain-containing protein n=3 Tax=Corynebacterium phocae TaxID=161895 RepID=A0A1L7D129_9CORY|nr:hypothetical protein CPHO_01455 [Corynebacterium phocae]